MLPISLGALNGYLKASPGLNVVTDLFEGTMYLKDPSDPESSSERYRQVIGQLKVFDIQKANWNIITRDIHDDFRKKVLEFRPDVIAISATDYTHGQSDDLIEGIHEWYRSDVFVISGGIFPTMLSKEALLPKDMDAICVGEGYVALEQVCRALQEGGDPYAAPNLGYMKNGVYVNNPPAQLIDLNVLPLPDYSIFPNDRMTRQWFGVSQVMLPITINIGCPYNCRYCANQGFHNLAKRDKIGPYIRYKSVDYLKKEMLQLTELYNPDMWYFSSENFFTYPKQWMEEFKDFYISELGAKPFWSETRVENINPHNLKILKDMGISRLSVGLEAGNESFRINKCNKTFTNKMFLDAVSLCAEYGVNLTVNNIIGLLDSKREYEFDTINLNRKAIALADGRIDVGTTVTIFSPASGSDMHIEARERNLFDFDKYIHQKWGSFHRENWLNQPQFPPNEVKKIYEAFVLYTHMPKSYWPQIDFAEYNSDDPKRAEAYDMLMELFRNKYE